MENFHKQQEQYAPKRLSQKRAEEIAQEIDDPRLSAEEDTEHFVISFREGNRYIPKREETVVEGKGVDIEEYLKAQLEELE